jgi:hypothetical protein
MSRSRSSTFLNSAPSCSESPSGDGAAPAVAWPYRPQLPAQPRRARHYHDLNRDAQRINRWKGRVVALMSELVPWHNPIRHEIREGDLEDALERAIEDVVTRMTPRPDEDEDDAPSVLTDDVALAVGGKIVVLIKYSTVGPVVYRFDRG